MVLSGTGTDAGLDGAEEAVGKGGRIQQHQRAALLGLNPEAPQGVAEPVDPLGNLRVGDALVAALDRDLAAPSLGEMAIDKVGGGVEGIWQRHRTARIAKVRARQSRRDN